jgi:hypothetical protein
MSPAFPAPRILVAGDKLAASVESAVRGLALILSIIEQNTRQIFEQFKSNSRKNYLPKI